VKGERKLNPPKEKRKKPKLRRVRKVAILRPSEIRDMNVEEMKAKIRELRAELARARATAGAGGSLENPARIREIRRTVARILTIMKEKQKGGA
jgi:large subunit ribosomal protein L29